MEIQDFVKCVAEQYEEVDAQEFTPETQFKTFEEWSSLISLSIIAAIDDEFGVTLKGDDIRKATTIQDLFDAAKAKE